jgi:hypothetical protein
MRPPTTVARAAVVGGVLSGVPSALHAALTHRPPLESTRAAGTLLGRPSVPRGLVAHAAVTVWWTCVLAVALPRRRAAAWGAAAGLGIGLLDLGVVAGRRSPAIAALPRWPQLADHVAFGALAGAVLGTGGRRGLFT